MFLILILLIHLQHLTIVDCQEGKVDDETKPTLHPTLQPTAQYPKYVTFTMSILMANANFDVDTNGGDGELTLDSLFRRTLCECTFSFPANQCHERIIKHSPHPTTSPTTEPTFDPTHDPTADPTYDPTLQPSLPTLEPTTYPTLQPTTNPTVNPTQNTNHPTNYPTNGPTFAPSYDPTFEPTNVPTLIPTQSTKPPTNGPTVEPTSNPTVNPSVVPSSHPTVNPSSHPSINPTFEPTLEPTLNPTLEPTTEPTMEPTMEPTVEPSQPTTARRRIRRLSDDYDLDLQFYVMVTNRKEEDVFYQRIKSYYFFNEFKQCLLDSLNSPYVLTHYQNTSIMEYKQDIESMQISPLNDLNILSPTYAPTSYPTYNYKQGEDYGYWMIGIGVCLMVSVIAYWFYRRYTIHLDYKAEQKSAPPNNIELQTLFKD